MIQADIKNIIVIEYDNAYNDYVFNLIQHIYIYNVINPIIILPFGDGLHNPFMVILGMFRYWDLTDYDQWWYITTDQWGYIYN
jgi:hypothetical protein